jgi:hypothetical protein
MESATDHKGPGSPGFDDAVKAPYRTEYPVMPKSRLLAFIIKELKELLPPTVFFAISFNLILLTTQPILADYLVHFLSFLVATTSALVVGKSVLLADALPFFRRFDAAPMIRSVLFKTIVYWSVVFLVQFLEKLVEYWFGGGTIRGIPDYIASGLLKNRWRLAAKRLVPQGQNEGNQAIYCLE